VKLIYLITLFLFSTVAFQNCAGGGAQSAAADSPVGIVAHQNKVVGLYDLPSVKQIHYYSSVPAPDLNISINVESPEAAVSIYDNNGHVKCVLHPEFSGEQYANLLSQLAETSLSNAQGANAATCQAQYLELTLADGSTHTYPFLDGCQPDGDASIVSLESSLQAVLVSIIASSGESCPAN